MAICEVFRLQVLGQFKYVSFRLDVQESEDVMCRLTSFEVAIHEKQHQCGALASHEAWRPESVVPSSATEPGIPAWEGCIPYL